MLRSAFPSSSALFAALFALSFVRVWVGVGVCYVRVWVCVMCACVMWVRRQCRPTRGEGRGGGDPENERCGPLGVAGPAAQESVLSQMGRPGGSLLYIYIYIYIYINYYGPD